MLELSRLLTNAVVHTCGTLWGILTPLPRQEWIFFEGGRGGGPGRGRAAADWNRNTNRRTNGLNLKSLSLITFTAFDVDVEIEIVSVSRLCNGASSQVRQKANMWAKFYRQSPLFRKKRTFAHNSNTLFLFLSLSATATEAVERSGRVA